MCNFRVEGERRCKVFTLFLPQFREKRVCYLMVFHGEVMETLSVAHAVNYCLWSHDEMMQLEIIVSNNLCGM